MKSQTIENVLNEHPTVQWEYRTIPIAHIDESASLRNQARVSQPINRDRVSQYKDCLVGGDEFPAIVVYYDRKDRYVVLDGNHRWQAFTKAGRTTIDAYVCIVPDATLRNLLTYEFNNVMNCLAPSEEDRDHHAVNLLSQGWTTESVARTLRLPKSRVDEAYADYRGHERSRIVGVNPAWTKISARGARVRLYKGMKLDSTFAKGVVIASKFGYTLPDVRQMVHGVDALGSEAEQLDYLNKTFSDLEKVRIKIEADKKAKRVRVRKRNIVINADNPRHLFLAHVGGIAKSTLKDVMAGMDSDEREAMLIKIKSARQTLDAAELVINSQST